MIYELLPLLDGWVRYAKEEYNISVKDGKEEKIAEFTRSGWIVGAAVKYTGSPFTTFNIYYHDITGKRHVLSSNPAGLRQMGLMGISVIHGATLTRANDSKQEYVIVMSPNTPIPFFASNDYPMKVTVKADGDINIDYIGYEVVLIIDRERFIKSLGKILGCVGGV